MNRHVNAIAGRLSLRPPQRSSLEILDRITEIVPPKKEADVAAGHKKGARIELARGEKGAKGEKGSSMEWASSGFLIWS